MALSTYQIQIHEDFTIGPSTDYTVLGWSGFGLDGWRVSDDPAPLQHGVWFGPEYLGGRSILLEVHVRGDDPSDTMANIDALVAAWQLDTSGDGYGAVTTLDICLPGVGTRRLYGRPRRVAGTLDRVVHSNAQFTLEFVAGNPRWQSPTLSQQVFTPATASVGRGYNRSFNYGYGGATDSGIEVCNNAGTAEAIPVLRIDGPCTTPSLINETTGKTLTLDYTLASGEYLLIDFYERTVLLDGTASRFYAKRGDWWGLAPGDNEIRFAVQSSSSPCAATLSWRSAWL